VGLGSIGTGIAQRAKAFRMNTLYYSRTRKKDLEQEMGKNLNSQIHGEIQIALFNYKDNHGISILRNQSTQKLIRGLKRVVRFYTPKY